jgi:aspartate kinase
MDAASSSVLQPAASGPGSVPSSIAVIKIGGSVLTGHQGYARVASCLADRHAACPGERLLVVVSAESGHTDALLAEAVAVTSASHDAGSRGRPDSSLLDLLWSTGETRSVALLALSLRARGIAATGLSVHETGLERRCGSDRLRLASTRLGDALTAHAVVIVPGFLATCDQRIVSLGRGGSDWSAVALAIALGAGGCELVKDVDGYFTDDPATSASAARIPQLSYRDALRMADDGCPVLQRPAIVAAARARLPLRVRSLAGTGTLVQE